MAMKCVKCKKDIVNRDIIGCSTCKCSYHLACSGVSTQRFNIMTREHKNAWKCNGCWDIHHQKSKQSSTPNISFDESPNYVTQRNKLIVNVSTENSFSSLPSDEELGDNSTMTNALNRSCPDFNTCNTIILEEMKEKIIYLQEKLDIADNEIVSILSENYQLKDKLNECEKKIKHLTVICKSTNTLQTTTKKKKRKSFPKPNTILLNNTHETEDCSYTALNIEQDLNVSTVVNNTTCLMQKSLTEAPNNHVVKTKQTNKIDYKHKILIIGENSVTGLASALFDSRREKWNDIYSIFGYVQPNASSTQILNYCNDMQYDLNEKDIVVLGIGGHDNNPNLLHKNYCLVLSKFMKCTVYIVPVNFNPALNERTLNYHLKLWSQNFKNCIFMNSVKAFYRSKTYTKYLLTRKLNMLIDSRDYNCNFLSIKNCKNMMGIALDSGIATKSVKINKSTCPAKCVTTAYTIPYFFNIMKKKTNSGTNKLIIPEKTCFRP